MTHTIWLSVLMLACTPKGGGDTAAADIDLDGDGWAEDDCDDADADIHPDAEEVCDGVDNDCDGEIDEGVTRIWYADGDGDGHGDAADSTAACGQPSGYVSDGADCDDTSEAVYPGAAEICGDGRLNDCDGDLSSAFDACGISGTIDLSEADTKLIGEDSNDLVGRSVSGAGDTNGDGLADVIVGAYGDEEGGSRAGSAYLVLGSVSGSIDLSAAVRLTGEDSHDFAGYSVSGAGDTDGDGLDDVLVGAYGNDRGGDYAGIAYLVLGGISGSIDLSDADAALIGDVEDGYAGFSVSGAGDTNGDGLDDILIGAYGAGDRDGKVYLVLGGVSGSIDLTDADAALSGGVEDGYAGFSVSGAGDTNGDGLGDVLVGAYLAPEGGSAYLVLGGVSGSIDLTDADAKLSGENEGDGAGRSVSGAGDFDGDGLDDVIIGAYGHDEGGDYAGSAYLVLGGASGSVDLSDAAVELIGEDEGDYAGWSVSGAGDTNGDGLGDVLVGAYGADDGGTHAGVAYLVLGGVSGSVDLSDADARLVGEDALDLAGWSVSGAGDANGDGLEDILVGATDDDDGESNAGCAYLLYSASY